MILYEKNDFYLRFNSRLATSFVEVAGVPIYGSRIVHGILCWIGKKLTRNREKIDQNYLADDKALEQAGISTREYEVLKLIAMGYSNREIADKLFVSTNTIKTHTSNLFSKLNARRRTQAIQKAKELGFLR